MRKEYKTTGTCARQINIEVDDNGIIQEVEFIGGDDGEIHGIGRQLHLAREERIGRMPSPTTRKAHHARVATPV